MGVLLMLLTIGVLGAAVALVIFALATKRRWLAVFSIGGLAIWLAIYAVLLVGISLASTEKTLSINTPKAYCGFYLDCHIHTVVTGVRTAKTMGARVANGVFYIVGVRVFLDSRNPSISFRLIEPEAAAYTSDGEKRARDNDAEDLLPTAAVSLGGDIRGRQTIDKEIVFDLPEDAADPRLLITEGYGIDKVIEAVLIGDEDSVWHKRVYFDISEQKRSAGVL